MISDDAVRVINVVLSLVAWLLVTRNAWRRWQSWSPRMRLVKQGLAILCLSIAWGTLEVLANPDGTTRVYLVAVALVWVIAGQLMPEDANDRRRSHADC